MTKQEQALESRRIGCTACGADKYRTHKDDCPIAEASMQMLTADIHAIGHSTTNLLPMYRKASEAMGTNRVFGFSRPCWMN